MTATKTIKGQRPRRSGWRVFPARAYRLPGGELRTECANCGGDGHRFIYTSDSDYPGMSEGRRTAQKCGLCQGRKYSGNKITVIDVVLP